MQLSSQVKNEVQRNREILRPIVETIILCGRLGLAFRGHRDDGELNCEDSPTGDSGNFRALLQFKASSGDIVLQEHLRSGPRNASYISKTSQNALIKCIGDNIRERIVSKVNAAGSFTLIADGTTDASRKEQVSLCVRFYSNGKIHEEFLGFVDLEDQSAEGTADTILSAINTAGVDTRNLVGQCYDGCSTMAGIYHGVQARVKEVHPLATYVHCASHALNLCLSATSKVASIRNCFSTISRIAGLFRNSAKRSNILKNAIEATHGGKKTVLPKLCETRFVERHDAVLTFIELYESVAMALIEIGESRSEYSSEAMGLLSTISTAGFVISLMTLKHTLAATKPLSIMLQQKQMELPRCAKHIKLLKAQLQTWRDGTGTGCYDVVHSDATQIVGELQIDDYHLQDVSAVQLSQHLTTITAKLFIFHI